MINNFNILAVYDSTEEQQKNKWWAYGKASPIIVELNQIPTFQFPISTVSITEIVLINSRGQGIDILGSLTGFEVVTIDTYKLASYPALELMSTDLSIGVYSLRFSDGQQTYYSEHFNMCSDVSELLKIEYWHDENFEYREGVFAADFHHYTYLESVIAKPEYEYNEKISDRNGVNFILSQNVYKVYNFSLLLPEYLIDAFRVAVLSDNLKLSAGGSTLTVREITMAVEWLEFGDLAKVEFKAIGEGAINNIFNINTINPTVIEDDNNTVLMDDAGNVIGIFQ